MMPSAKIDSFSSAPPLNRLISWKTPLPLRLFVQRLTFLYDTPGAGRVAPIRYTTMIPRVNRIFLRRSGVAKAERNALSTRNLLGGARRAAAWPLVVAGGVPAGW